MFDRRFPWLHRLESAPLDPRGRGHAIRAGRDIANRCFCSVVWDERRGGLFCYLSEPDSGVHFVKMRRPDGSIRPIEGTELDTAVLYIQCSRQPRRVKDDWAFHHRRNDEIEDRVRAERRKAGAERGVLDHHAFLDRRRRGTSKTFTTL